eukprot:Nk52_evm4s153 gene=Nk52_evmTU4s153
MIALDDIGDPKWNYAMRREMQEIVSGVYLGPFSCVRNSAFFANHSIDTVVCVRHVAQRPFVKPLFASQIESFVPMGVDSNSDCNREMVNEKEYNLVPNGLNYLLMDISFESCLLAMTSVRRCSNPNAHQSTNEYFAHNLIQYFQKAALFIKRTLDRGGKCAVVGNTGLNMSASMVIAYIIMERGCDYEEAFRIVQYRRFCISPGENFARQLKEFVPICRAMSKDLNSQTNNNEHDVPNAKTQTHSSRSESRRRPDPFSRASQKRLHSEYEFDLARTTERLA